MHWIDNYITEIASVYCSTATIVQRILLKMLPGVCIHSC